MLNVQAMTQTMAAMSLPQLQQYAAMHKNDPYTVALALSIANQKKQAMTAQQGQAGMQPMPKVVDQALQQMAPQAAPRSAPMPEDVGIGQLPAPNIAKMAGGGIVAFGDGGEIPRYNGTGGSFVGPAMTFQQFLASQGITPSEFANAMPNQQQTLREAFKSTGMGAPSGAAPAAPAAPAAATSASAAPAATTPASPGRLYNIAKTAGGFARSSAPVAGGLEVLGNLGSYKFQEPGLDTSVSGVVDALGKGEFKQAAKNLAVGLPEAGLDLVRSGAGIGDIFLPGQPLTTGMDKLLKEKYGDKIRVPSDALAPTTATAATGISGQGEGAFPGATTPGVNAAPPPAAPTPQEKLAELKAQYKALVGPSGGAAASSTAGLPGLKMPTAEEAKASAAKLVDASPVIKQFEDYKNQVNTELAAEEKKFLEEQARLPKFGVKAEEQLKKREQELDEDKKAAGWMAVLEAGLATMASTSPFALANIGAGGQKGLASYKDAIKDFKKLQSEYDKMRNDIEKANVAEAREDFKARNEFRASAATRRDNLHKMGMEISTNVFKTTADVGAQIWNNGMREYGETARTVYREQGAASRAADENRNRVALGLMGLAQPPSELRYIQGLTEPDVAKLEKISAAKAAPKTEQDFRQDWAKSLMLQNKYPDVNEFVRIMKGTAALQSGQQLNASDAALINKYLKQ